MSIPGFNIVKTYTKDIKLEKIEQTTFDISKKCLIALNAWSTSSSSFCLKIQSSTLDVFQLLLKLSNNNCQSGCFPCDIEQKKVFYSMFMLHTTKTKLNVVLFRGSWLVGSASNILEMEYSTKLNQF